MWLDLINDIKTYKGGKPQFKNAFNYWRNILFNQVNKIFTWHNLPFPQKEIETKLILYGYCGIVKVDNTLISSNINQFGVTDYIDEFTDFNFATPLHSGTRKNHIDGVVVDNTPLRNSSITIIDRYSMLLAHCEITLINALVNGRSTKTCVASSQKMAQDVRDYQNKLYNGANDVIVDSSFIGIEFHDTDNSSLSSIKDLYDLRQNILYSFYEDMGIKTNQQKRERLIADEVSADVGLLRLNIENMFESRKNACEEINSIFGTNISVECNVDFNGNGIPEDSEMKGSEEYDIEKTE